MKLNAALVKALNAADVRKRLAEEGAEVLQYACGVREFFQKEITKWDGLFTARRNRLEVDLHHRVQLLFCRLG